MGMLLMEHPQFNLVEYFRRLKVKMDEVKCLRHSFYSATEFVLEKRLHFDDDKYVTLFFIHTNVSNI